MRQSMIYGLALVLLFGLLWSVSSASDTETWALVTDTNDEKQFSRDDDGNWELASQTDDEIRFVEHDPTPTPTPTPTDDMDTGDCGKPIDRWHGATVDDCHPGHEHGDPAPQWADDWSQAQFGHPVIYGGDEATPGENDHKHEGYKGFTYTDTANDNSEINLHVRLHAQSNPHGRSGRWHSYEVYVRDETGAVSFWQGWLDFGVVPDERFGFDTHTIQDARAESDNYIIASPEGYDERERWFAKKHPWQWIVTLYFEDFTAFYEYDEHENDPTNIEMWNLTGEYGLDRRLRMQWMTGDDAPRGWFCATHKGSVTDTDVSGPDTCGDALPQYIASSMPDVRSATKLHVWDGPVELPN